MPHIHARAEVAGEVEARRLAEAIAARVGDNIPVSWSEHGTGWAVDAYFENAEASEIAARLSEPVADGVPAAPFEVKALDETDWVAESLKGLAPVRAGRFVVHGSHDRTAVRAGEIAVEIEAGQAFGTGHHGTTAGCLEALDRLLKLHAFNAPLDLGTGSGVLAIACARATRRPVLASDIDPLATEVARGNARLNGVAGLVSVVTATGFEHPALRRATFDLVIANILAGPLMALAPAVRRRLAPGGVVILSGILDRQASRVDAAFRAQGLYRCFAIAREGWSTLVLRGG